MNAFYTRLSVIFFVIQVLIRTILVFQGHIPLLSAPGIFLRGFFWDLTAWAFMGLPVFLISMSLPKKFLENKISKAFGKVFAFVLVFALAFVGFCELTFWEEFHSRFNFIAVDYLIYTNEVIANINESFPMPKIFSGIAVFTLIALFLVYKYVNKAPTKKVAAVAVTMPLILGFFVAPWMNTLESDFRKDQVSRNGWTEFYRAFRSNHISYRNFYSTVPDKTMHAYVDQREAKHPEAILKTHTRPHVVMIVVESLGAKFIAPLGGKKNVTPYLNALADKSIFFENLYSTGTRTVRGLEALNLSVPPTPGYAVVKRPEHKNLYSLGHTFSTNGYDPVFLYGGNGFFDNMNSFFEGNGFRTVDQTDFADNEVTFSNAWGVCDEDMFGKAMKLMDEPSAKPKLLFMLTTSNHRPFTYPNGRIDIPSGTGRDGAVKYTDFAIGQFLDKAQKKSWAKDTIFIVVADHSTEGRGRFALEMADFHIPMWITSPMLKPKRMNKLVSQIDLLPSLVHLLGLKDNSPFFGKSFFDEKNTEERAFIGNYQFVGYYKDKVLTTLGPNRNVRAFTYDPATRKQKDFSPTPSADEAISYYQYASDLLDGGKYRAPSPGIVAGH